MKKNFKYDCCGWVTKNDLRCSDGKTIRHGAFSAQDGAIVPCVWNHQHGSVGNVLGKVLLEARDSGIYGYASFNNTENGQDAKEMVAHGDVDSFSIYANNVKSVKGDVLHGVIREVSLVLAGANPGAKIEYPVIAHGDGYDVVEAEIRTGEVFEHSEGEVEYDETETVEHAENNKEDKMDNTENKTKETEPSDKTIKEVWDGMTEDQKIVAKLLALDAVTEATKNNKEDTDMKHNAFENNNEVIQHADEELMHAAEQIVNSGEEILASAASYGRLSKAILAHAAEYGIDNIDWLFPDPKTIQNKPDWIRRDDSWVTPFMNALHKTPFSRVKSIFANITEGEARAKGYITGKRKKEEVFTLLKRSTDPQTIYKKQAIDRDNEIDASELFDVLPWIKEEMSIMFREEFARAVLVGDGRDTSDDDKISEDHIRSVYHDNDLFSVKVEVKVANNATADTKCKAFLNKAIKSRKYYKGTGTPNLYTNQDMLADLLLMEDDIGHKLYPTIDDLKKTLRVREIYDIDVLNGISRIDDNGRVFELAGIIFNPADYNVGSSPRAKAFFEDFDIDYNQRKYLMEDRMSGALVKPFSALVIEFNEDEDIVTSIAPVAGSETLFGKDVSELQGKIRLNGAGDGLVGVLNYVTGYTGYSGDAALQKGNFIALQFTAVDGATVKVGLDPTEGSGMVTLDSDMNCVIRVANAKKQVLVVEATLDAVTVRKTYSLSGLVCKHEAE